MEARSRAINADRSNVSSDEDWKRIDHPEAPGQPTESTAAAHPEPPRTDAKVPEQKPKGPESQTTPVSLSLTWQGIGSAHVHDRSVSANDCLIHQKAAALVKKAAESIWNLKPEIWHLNRYNSSMYPVTHSNSIQTAEFKFLLKLEYDGAEGENYCEGRVEGESDDGCIGIIRYGNHRISELRNKDGVVVEMGVMSGAPPRLAPLRSAPPRSGSIHDGWVHSSSGWVQTGPGRIRKPPLRFVRIHDAQPGSGQIHGASLGSG
ncbi:hypothetical protein F5051DRAFT_393154 [Lentinula edodes]|nr:hypothetical protein F5051DRAFT_393154 [Lentinula edodes]